MSAEIACLGINQIIMNSLNSAFRTLLRSCAENVNNNFDNLNSMSADERLESIIRMFGLEEEDAVKIIKPAPKKSADGTIAKKIGKSRAEKPLPMPFWGEKTVNREKCHGLQAGLYNQCDKSPVDGSIYCKKCKEEADKNDHGMPNRGNIKVRLEQFKEDYYDYTTPDDKCRKVYIGSWAEKKDLSQDKVVEIFQKNGIELNKHDKENMFYIPAKKKNSKSKKGLTEDMEKKPKGNKKGKPTPGRPSPLENDDNDDDAQSVCSEATEATQYDDDDEDNNTVATEVPEDGDEDEENDLEIPEPEFDITKFTTIKAKNCNYGVLIEEFEKYKKNNDCRMQLYEITNFESKTSFEIVSTTPIGELHGKTITLYK